MVPAAAAALIGKPPDGRDDRRGGRGGEGSGDPQSTTCAARSSSASTSSDVLVQRIAARAAERARGIGATWRRANRLSSRDDQRRRARIPRGRARQPPRGAARARRHCGREGRLQQRQLRRLRRHHGRPPGELLLRLAAEVEGAEPHDRRGHRRRQTGCTRCSSASSKRPRCSAASARRASSSSRRRCSRRTRTRPKTRSASGSPATSAAAPATTRSSAPCSAADERAAAISPRRGLRRPMVATTEKPTLQESSAPARSAPTARTRSPAAPQYGADVHLTGMLFGRVLRSPHAHASIKRIDTSQGAGAAGRQGGRHDRRLPRAEPATHEPRRGRAQPECASWTTCSPARRCSTTATPVAAVAADGPHIAEDALALIEVEYEVLPAVAGRARGDARTARRSCTTTSAPRDARAASTLPDKPTNIAAHLRFEKGDLDAGLRAGRHRHRARVRRRPCSTRATSSRTTARPTGTATAS